MNLPTHPVTKPTELSQTRGVGDCLMIVYWAEMRIPITKPIYIDIGLLQNYESLSIPFTSKYPKPIWKFINIIVKKGKICVDDSNNNRN